MPGEFWISEDFNEPLEFIESRAVDKLDEAYQKFSKAGSLSESELKEVMNLIHTILLQRESLTKS